jgi:hypothetical protein
MSRKELPLPQEHSASFDLETCVNEAATLNQRTFETFTLPFPKAPDRWLSHDQFRPRPVEFTGESEVEGGLSWLMGATIDLSFTRSLFQRGTKDWQILYAARTASERTNSYDQEVLDNGRPPKLRGLKAFRFVGAIRTLAHLLRRAITCILDVMYTMGKLLSVKT